MSYTGEPTKLETELRAAIAVLKAAEGATISQRWFTCDSHYYALTAAILSARKIAERNQKEKKR